MTDYQRNVLMPALREEAAIAGAKLRALLPRKLRKGLVDDGRWLKPECARATGSLGRRSARASSALVEHRERLADVLEARGNDAAARLQQPAGLVRRGRSQRRAVRCRSYSARLKGYSLQVGVMRARRTQEARAVRCAELHSASLLLLACSFADAGQRAGATHRRLPRRRWMSTATATSRWSNTRTG